MPVPAESSSLAVCEYGYWGVNLMTFYPFYPAFYPAKVLDMFDNNLHYRHGWRMPYGRCGRCHTNFARATATFCPFVIIGHTNFDLLVNHIMFWPHQLWKPSSAHDYRYHGYTGWFPKLVWPKHNMVDQQVKVGVANNDNRAKCWCGTGKVGVATATPAIRHSPPMTGIK